MLDPMIEIVTLENAIRDALAKSLTMKTLSPTLRAVVRDGQAIIAGQPTAATGTRLARLREIAEALKINTGN